MEIVSDLQICRETGIDGSPFPLDHRPPPNLTCRRAWERPRLRSRFPVFTWREDYVGESRDLLLTMVVAKFRTRLRAVADNDAFEGVGTFAFHFGVGARLSF